ncbi:MAG TPA: inorganic phosphate transporter [Anaerolineales bacterium]|nr:inorganic phosphate transporter [Anaerolineales bacterium]
MLLLLIVLALIYAFLNGYRDTSSVLAGVVASRAIRPRLALYLVAIADFIAPFLFGSAVARSIAVGLVNSSAISLRAVVVAMIATLGWNIFAWWRGIPSSSTHALIGGLLGAILMSAGPNAILITGLLFVLLPLVIGPMVGLILGALVMSLLSFALRGATPKVNTLFRRIQIITMLVLAMSNSSNDSYKSMGIIALGLVLTGHLSSFAIPNWVLVTCAATLALGSSFGDWRQIRNLGGKIYRIRPLNALASQAASSVLIVTASVFGMPVSTPHLISTALMGAGAAERINKVRWQVATEMATAWALTIPATIVISALICKATMSL